MAIFEGDPLGAPSNPLEYAEELKRANENANKARYGAGMTASAPARFYNSTPTRAM